MSVITINHKDLNALKLPNGFKALDNTIFLEKNTVLKDTTTIKLIDQATTNLRFEFNESVNAKIILDIEDSMKKDAIYNIELINHNNAQINFLLVSSIHDSNSTINLNSVSYSDSNLLFYSSLVSDHLNANFNLDLNGKGSTVLVNTITVSSENHVQNLDVHLTHNAPYTNADM